jgi:hypothetical protein
MDNLARQALAVAKAIQQDVPRRGPPPDEVMAPESEQVLPFSLVRGTRGYLEKVVNQINGSYENGWFDACAVMIRRLVETLIIEAFEEHGITHKIKDSSGNFFYLKDLIRIALAEARWNLGRNTKNALPELKDIGDLSAHSRRFTAQRGDIDRIIKDLRVVAQELIYLANLK